MSETKDHVAKVHPIDGAGEPRASSVLSSYHFSAPLARNGASDVVVQRRNQPPVARDSEESACVFPGGDEIFVQASPTRWLSTKDVLEPHVAFRGETPSAAESLALARDASWLGAGFHDGSLGLFTVSGETICFVAGAHESSIGHLATCSAKDASEIICSASKEKARVWKVGRDLATNAITGLQELARIEPLLSHGHDKQVRYPQFTCLSVGSRWQGELQSFVVLGTNLGKAVVVDLQGGLLGNKKPTTVAGGESMASPTVFRCMDVSEDGHWLVAGCGAELKEGQLHSQAVDEETALSQNAIMMWSIWRDAAVVVLEGHKQWVRDVQFIPKSSSPPRGAQRRPPKYVVSASSDHEVRVWDIDSASTIRKFKGHQQPVRRLACTSNMAFVVSTGGDNTIRMWDFLAAKEHRVVDISSFSSEKGDAIRSMAMSDDMGVLVVGCKASGAHVFRRSGEAFVRFAAAHDREHHLSRREHQPDLSSHMSDAEDGGGKPLDSSEDEAPNFLRLRDTDTSTADWSVGADSRGRASSTDSRKKSKPSSRSRVKGGRESMNERSRQNRIKDFTGLGRSHVLSACEAGMIHVWDVHDSARPAHSWCAHAGTTLVAVAVSTVWIIDPDAHQMKEKSYVATTAYSGEVKLWSWSLERGHDELFAVHDHTRPCYVDLSANGRIVVTGGKDLALNWYDIDLSSGQSASSYIEKAHDSPIRAVAISRDEYASMLASGCVRGITRVWDRESGNLLHLIGGHSSWITSLAFPHESQEEWRTLRLVTGSSDATAKLWSLGEEGVRELVSFEGHDGYVNSVALSSDGRFVATGGSDQTVRIWSVQGRCLRVFPHAKSILRVRFAPDMSYVAVSLKSHTPELWRNVVFEDFQPLRSDQILPAWPTVIERFKADLRSATVDRSYTWDRFARADPTIVAEVCLCDPCPDFTSDVNVSKPDGDAGEEKRSTRFVNTKTTSTEFDEALLKKAVRDDKAKILSILLSRAPHAMFLPYDNLSETLLSRCLAVQSPSCVRVLLNVIHEFLTWSPDVYEGDEDMRYISSEFPNLLPFLGDAAPLELQKGIHASDLVCVDELNRVAALYPELFMTFVESLKLVPNYQFVLVSDPKDPKEHSARFSNPRFSVQGSMDRSHGSPEKLFKETQTQRGLSKASSFWRVHATATGVDFDSDLAVQQVSPWIVPIKDIAVAKDEVSFLAEVVKNARLLNDFRAFESEVVTSLVQYKWEAVVKWQFWRDCGLFVALSVIFVFYALTFDSFSVSSRVGERVFGFCLWLTILVLVLYFIVREAWQITKFCQQQKALTYLVDAWNVLDLLNCAMIVTSLAFQLFVLVDGPSNDANRRLVNIVNAATMPTLSGQLLFFLQGEEESGKLVRMTIKITKGITVFTCVLFVFIVAFAAAFTLLFRSVDNRDEALEFDGYSHFENSLLSVFAFLLGDFSISDLNEATSPELAFILLALFLFVTGIILLNLLIAIMGDRYGSVQEHAEAEATFARAQLILEYEALATVGKDEDSKGNAAYIQVLKKGGIEDSPYEGDGGFLRDLKRDILARLDEQERKFTQREHRAFRELQEYFDQRIMATMIDRERKMISQIGELLSNYSIAAEQRGSMASEARRRRSVARGRTSSAAKPE